MGGPNIPVPSCSQAPLGQSCCCCKRCEIGGCDIRLNCGCCFHARCCPIRQEDLLSTCPVCHANVVSVTLLPMVFEELDQARIEAARTGLSEKRGKKRKNATIARLQPMQSEDGKADGSDLRTGRWTPEETAYCDKLIQLFEEGELPIPDGAKLNDFLSNMLKSKQSRLTKKMKNAKLSARQYQRKAGFVLNTQEARSFSMLETEFFASIRCNMERAEIRFHMQKEWRELFSSFCVGIGLKLDANGWLSSVEEMDRRTSLQKDAARMARRKVMMGYALNHDTVNSESGVFIDRSLSVESKNASTVPTGNYFSTGAEVDIQGVTSKNKSNRAIQKRKPGGFYASPFLGRVISYMRRHNVPFEHIDAWVPSFVPTTGAPPAGGEDQQCRLCFGGFASSEVEVTPGSTDAVALSSDDQFDLLSFGVYSQKFSFQIGCGLPGRVYSTGVSSWEQGIQNAPNTLFERCGGACQWGIQTVVGIPVPSPNVGRVVVLFYSRHDRHRDQDLVSRLSEELKRLMPAPKWKLVVDVGDPRPPLAGENTVPKDDGVDELQRLINAYTPQDKNSPLVPHLPGFTSLRLLLLKTDRSRREKELLKVALAIFGVHKQSGRSERDVAWMTARDFMSRAKSINGEMNGTGLSEVLPLPTPHQLMSLPGSQDNGILSSAHMGLADNLSSLPDLAINNLGGGSVPHQTSVGQQEQRAAQSPAQHSQSHHEMVLPPGLAPLGLSASQVSALLQNDAALNFQGM